MRRYLMLLLTLLFLMLQACKPASTSHQANVVPIDPKFNSSLGKLFLARNQLRPGVNTTASGLQYMVIQNGMGIKPKIDNVVTIYYQGRYIDGKSFDDKHAQQHPLTMRIADMIPGLQEALTSMSPGAIWIVYLPSQLAFGEKGLPGFVGPNQALIYYVHLLGVAPPNK